MKDLVMEVTRSVTEKMPNNASIAEIIDAIVVRLSALKGFKDIDEGRFVTQEQLLEDIEKW